MKSSVAVAVSGGIDSLVAAYLLKKQGYEVTGVYFFTGYEQTDCLDLTVKDLAEKKASYISSQLGVAVDTVDCRNQFKKKVVDYFVKNYQAGLTPNPCVVCNQYIKFGIVLDYVKKIGASCLATGHYARISKNSMNQYQLFKGVDLKKEQTYFLGMLKQKQLERIKFPLGDFTKSHVIKIAEENGLSPISRKESQDVCFIPEGSYAKFMEKQPGFKPEHGFIEDCAGNIIGRHKGLHLFTIGQRRGINCPAKEAYYVLDINVGKKRLIVGNKKSLLDTHCKVAGINWISKKPDTPLKVHTRLRYRHRMVSSTVFPGKGNTAIIKFEEPQSAITPGQCAVFYDDDKVLGGGWIMRNKERT